MPSAWVQHVKAYYQARKKKDATYKYKDAMRDARATYKKKGKAEEKTAEPAPKKRKRRKLASKKKNPMLPGSNEKGIENRSLR